VKSDSFSLKQTKYLRKEENVAMRAKPEAFASKP